MQPNNETEVVAEQYAACFDDLPNGAVHHVFRFLGPKELCVASAVCKHWRDLNRDGVANRARLRTIQRHNPYLIPMNFI